MFAAERARGRTGGPLSRAICVRAARATNLPSAPLRWRAFSLGQKRSQNERDQPLLAHWLGGCVCCQCAEWKRLANYYVRAGARRALPPTKWSVTKREHGPFG